VVRLPAEVSAQVEDDPTGGKLAAAMGKLNGAPHKLTSLCHFHVGDTVTSLQLAAMVEGGEQVILYTTIMGSVGALVGGCCLTRWLAGWLAGWLRDSACCACCCMEHVAANSTGCQQFGWLWPCFAKLHFLLVPAL
jgi:uncharacterized membrane protein YeaQ/YmgE (transglycosylase-associated protein family)